MTGTTPQTQTQTPVPDEEPPKEKNDNCLSMLHSSMDHATAYEYLLQQGSHDSGNGNDNDKGNDRVNGDGCSQQTKRASSTPSSEKVEEKTSHGTSETTPQPQTTQASWWLQVLHRQQEQHVKDREQWQQQLQKTQKNSTEYKSELKDNLQQRLHWLEFNQKQQQQPAHNALVVVVKEQGDDCDDASIPSVSKTSTVTTYGSSAGSGASSSSVYGGDVGGGGASNRAAQEIVAASGVEVTYDSSQAVCNLALLEQTYEETVRMHESERDEWVEKLDRAAKVTNDGQELSKSMQSQLLELAEGIQKGTSKQRKQWKERVRTLEQLAELTEQQHRVEKAEWQQEIDVLENTVARLASDVQKQATEFEELSYEKEVLKNTVAQLVANKAKSQNDQVADLTDQYQIDKTSWQNEKYELKNLVARLTADEQRNRAELNEHANEKATLNNTIAQLIGERANHQQTSRSLSVHGSPSRSPAVTQAESYFAPSPRRLDWDDKLDRAMVERDVFQQEAKKGKRMLEEVNARHAREKEEWSAETDSQLQELRDQQLFDMKNLEDAVDNSTDEMYKRYQQSVEKRNELVSKIHKLEQHQVSEKGSWKLRLESALLESRALQDEKTAVERELEHMKLTYSKAVDEWSTRLRISRKESDEQLEELRNKHTKEMQGILNERTLSSDYEQLKGDHDRDLGAWKMKLDASKTDTQHQLRLIKDLHAEEVRTWSVKAEASEDEIRNLIDRINDLASRLEQIQGIHSREKRELEAKLETSRRELEIDQANGELEQFQHVVSNAIEELRLDVTSIRETIESSAHTDEMLEKSYQNQMLLDLEQFQHAVSNAIEELRLDVAMLDSSTAVKSLADKFLANDAGAEQSSLFQHKLMAELGEMRNQLGNLLELDSNPNSSLAEALRQRYESELQMKEMAIVACESELQQTRDELATERRNRKKIKRKANSGIKGGIPMRFHTAGDFDEGDSQRVPGGSFDNASNFEGSVDGKADDASPMLEEALALAHGLTDIVHGRGDHNKETSVMEMLESLSDMMDRADRGKCLSGDLDDAESSIAGDDTPLDGHNGRAAASIEAYNEDAMPDPVMTPVQIRQADPNALDLVVEQLFQRCQLLERERSDTMEVTMDLLETAREANAAELDAALATFRLKSSDELIMVQQQNQLEMSRVYQKLCGNCKHDILQV